MTESEPFTNRLICSGRNQKKDAVPQAVYIDLWRRNHKWRCLLDSGCETSVVPENIMRGERLDPPRDQLYAANGSIIPVIGEAEVGLKYDGVCFPTRVSVSPHITEPLLGADWLQRHECLWDFGGKYIIIKGKRIPLQARKGEHRICRRVVVDRDTVIPAWSVGDVHTKVESNQPRRTFIGMSWMTENREFLPGVCVARTLVPDRFGDVPVQIANVTKRPVNLRAGTVVSELSPVQVNEPSSVEGSFGQVPEHVRSLIEQVDESVEDDVKEKLRGLLCKYGDVFSAGEYDLGDTSVVRHTIDTGCNRPVKQQLRRQPVHLLEDIDKEVEHMLKAGVIEPTSSPWSSNVVVVKKKDGSLRFCIDYRRLNDITRKDVYPLPRIDACLDAMGGSRFFSTFDLRSGYHQVQMHDDDADKTSFVTRKGAFRFRRLPFGLCNAGSTFQRLMDVVMKGATFEICLVYLDDIIVYSEDADEHIRRLEIVFSRLRSASLKLKPSKCNILQRSVTFLGHVVSGEGLATDPDKITAVLNWPRPGNQREVRSFLGLCSYYRRFVREFAAVASPLHALTGKNVIFTWTIQCEEAFQQLKTLLTTSPILAMPLDVGRFILDTDACDVSIGAVLSQEQNGVERVIAYSSRSLSKPERNYCVTRKELLAVVYYVKAFRMYLLGRPFLVRTDHSALQWLRRTPEPIGQQARWCEILEEFQFDIQHRPGRSHTNADALSRRPCRQCGDGSDETMVKVRTVFLNRPSEVPDSLYNPDVLAKAYQEDPELRHIYNFVKEGPQKPDANVINGLDSTTKSYASQWNRLSIVSGGLYRRWFRFEKDTDTLQLIPPVSYREEIVIMAHSGLTGGHIGLRRTKLRVQKKAYWIGWSRQVEALYRRCDRCARYYRGLPKRQGELQSAPVGEVWERLAIDVTGPHPKSRNGFCYIVTVLDLFSKWAFAFPVRNHEAITVAHLLVDKVFSVFGIPQQLLSDRGPEFEGNLMRELCHALEIDKLRTTAYKPSTNGAIERFHRSLNALLGKVVSDNQRDWDQWIPAVLSAYHASPHDSTGFTPNYLMLGREVRVPLDLAFGEPDCEEGIRPVYCEYVEEKRMMIQRAFDLARTNLGVSAFKRKERYDLKVKPAKFAVGEFVWYYYPRKLIGKSAKWQGAYQGPFLVVEVINNVNYVIQRTPRANKQVVHVDKLKICYSELRNSWIAPPLAEEQEVAEGDDVELEPIEMGGNDVVSDRIRSPTGSESLAPLLDSHSGVIELTEPNEGRTLRPRSRIHPPHRLCLRVTREANTYVDTDCLSISRTLKDMEKTVPGANKKATASRESSIDSTETAPSKREWRGVDAARSLSQRPSALFANLEQLDGDTRKEIEETINRALDRPKASLPDDGPDKNYTRSSGDRRSRPSWRQERGPGASFGVARFQPLRRRPNQYVEQKGLAAAAHSSQRNSRRQMKRAREYRNSSCRASPDRGQMTNSRRRRKTDSRAPIPQEMNNISTRASGSNSVECESSKKSRRPNNNGTSAVKTNSVNSAQYATHPSANSSSDIVDASWNVLTALGKQESSSLANLVGVAREESAASFDQFMAEVASQGIIDIPLEYLRPSPGSGASNTLSLRDISPTTINIIEGPLSHTSPSSPRAVAVQTSGMCSVAVSVPLATSIVGSFVASHEAEIACKEFEGKVPRVKDRTTVSVTSHRGHPVTTSRIDGSHVNRSSRSTSGVRLGLEESSAKDFHRLIYLVGDAARMCPRPWTFSSLLQVSCKMWPGETRESLSCALRSFVYCIDIDRRLNGQVPLAEPLVTPRQ